MQVTFKNDDFPDIEMCQSNQNIARVHGCMWCGKCNPPHPARDCPKKGESLPPGDAQMSMALLLALGATMPKKDTEEEARAMDNEILKAMQLKSYGAN